MSMTATDHSAAIHQMNTLFGRIEDDLFIIVNHKRKHGAFLTETFPIDQREQAASFGIEQSEKGAEVWVRITPMAQAPSSGRGKADDSTCMVGLFADIDFGKADGLPDEQTALDVLGKVMPIKPTMIVRSGHGLHPYWCLVEPMYDIDEAKALAKRWKATIQQGFAQHGYKVDSVFDLARVLRLAGTMNYKADPVPVELAEHNPNLFYAPADIEQYLIDLDEPLNDGDIDAAPEPAGTVEDVLPAMRKIKVRSDEDDGSKRLFAYACRAVEHDLSDADAIKAIRAIERERPFPNRIYSDQQIEQRLRDAEKQTTRGEALTGDHGDGNDQPKKSQADKCVEIAQDGIDLFHTPGGHDSEGYATISVGDHVETWPINSKAFRRYLSRLYYGHFSKAPGSQAMQDALGVLSGQAIYEGDEHEVHVRIAEHDDAIYLDLGDADWRVVEVTSSGWRIIESSDCAVRFVRKRGMLALPEPQHGGSVDELRELVNCPSDDYWKLIVAWLVAALRATGPYPVLAVNGEQGSAKSTLCRMLRALIDPNYSPLRRPPKEERDLMIAAGNGWIVGYDNLSGLPASLSDALCCLATGGGFATRELYSDDDEKLFVAQRPVQINGIDEVATRPDLLDRSLNITLPTIPEDQRRDEADLNAMFDQARPRIMGALLDAVSAALANVGSVRLDRLPRMADFARWIAAAEPVLGWERGAFMAAYSGNREQATESAIEASAVGPALLGLMAERSNWSGTAAELLTEIEANHSDESQRKRKGWPGSSKAMGNAVRRLAPPLRQVGIEVSFDREAGGSRRRIIVLERGGIAPSQTSQTSRNGDKSLTAGTEAGRSRDGRDGSGTMHRPTQNGPESVTTGTRDGRDGRDGRFPHDSNDELEV